VEEKPETNEKLWTGKFVLLTLCNLLLFLNLQMMTPSFPAYVKDQFGASDFTVSLVISLFAFAAVVARIFTGKVLQPKNSKTILLLGLSIVILATAGYVWAGTIAFLLVMRIVFGVGFGMTSTTFPTLASNVIPPKRMGEGMGYFGLSSSLAMSIAPVIGLWILGQFGFVALSASAVVLVIAIIPMLRIIQPAAPVHAMRENKEGQANQTGTPQIPSSKQQISKQPFPTGSGTSGASGRGIWLPAFLNLLLSITYGGLISFLALFGKEVHIDNVGWFFLCNAFAMVLIRPVSGKIFDKKGHWAVLPPGALLTVIGLVLVSQASSVPTLLTAALFYGLGYGIIQPSIQAWMIKQVSPAKRGMANGLFLNSIDLGIALGAMLLGAVASASSYGVMYRLSAGCMVLFLVVYLLSQLLERRAKAAASREEIGV
jgi:MFS family permease